MKNNGMTLTIWRMAWAALWLYAGLFSLPAFATCRIHDGKPPVRILFSPPALLVSGDTQPGTVIYSEHIYSESGRVDCDADGDIWQGFTRLTDADRRTDNPLHGVFQTTVPGIGFRAAWANNTTAKLEEGSLIAPWHMGVSKVKKQDAYYSLAFNAVVQFVVTGPVGSGVIDTSQLEADWKYDNQVVAELRFNTVTAGVIPATCSLVENNITVPLQDIVASEFTNNVSRVVTDERFKIQIEKCDPNIKVDYAFTTAGSTGVTEGNILTIASGDAAAQGVGIQILNSNNTVLQFDQEYTAVPQTSAGQSITIPLKARYIKTGTVKGGQVNAAATFEVYYR